MIDLNWTSKPFYSSKAQSVEALLRAVIEIDNVGIFSITFSHDLGKKHYKSFPWSWLPASRQLRNFVLVHDFSLKTSKIKLFRDSR